VFRRLADDIHRDRLAELVDLSLGGVSRDPVSFLHSAAQLVSPAGDYVELIIGELAPPFLHLAFELIPVPFDAIPVHVNLLLK
jgi:hypothetical protein